MRNNLWILSLVLLFVCSCDSEGVYDEYVNIDNKWNKDNRVEFKVQAPDTINPYDMFINIRNNADYKYNNLFLIVSIEHPFGKVIKDTLEYRMADEEGRFLGQGFSDIKENKLAYNSPDTPIIFAESGEYIITVEHAMRADGEVDGIKDLEGILEVGLRIEKHKITN